MIESILKVLAALAQPLASLFQALFGGNKQEADEAAKEVIDALHLEAKRKIREIFDRKAEEKFGKG